MLEVIIKAKGAPGSGKTRFTQAVESLVKDTPRDINIRVEVWTKQPSNPTWTRELYAKRNVLGEIVFDHTVDMIDEEPN